MNKSWLPWSAIEQIPQGMALEITPWLNGRDPHAANLALRGQGSKLRVKFPHLRPIVRGYALLIWYPSRQSAALIAEGKVVDKRKNNGRKRIKKV